MAPRMIKHACNEGKDAPHVARTSLSRVRRMTSGCLMWSCSFLSTGSSALATVSYGRNAHQYRATSRIQIPRIETFKRNCPSERVPIPILSQSQDPRPQLTFNLSKCALSSPIFHLTGKLILGPSALWFSTKLIPTMFLFSSLRKNRIPGNRHVSPAHRRVQETQRGNSSERYRLDMHRANWSSGCRGEPPEVLEETEGGRAVGGTESSLDAEETRQSRERD